MLTSYPSAAGPPLIIQRPVLPWLAVSGNRWPAAYGAYRGTCVTTAQRSCDTTSGTETTGFVLRLRPLCAHANLAEHKCREQYERLRVCLSNNPIPGLFRAIISQKLKCNRMDGIGKNVYDSWKETIKTIIKTERSTRQPEAKIQYTLC